MPIGTPPAEALREFFGATTRHTRRIEIYEQDGITRWVKDKVGRLKDGSVSVDYSRDERRGLDLTLTNDDQVLINAPGEFWYDKIIKVFRGVQINATARLPSVLIITDNTGVGTQAAAFRQALISIGFGDVQVNTLANDYAVNISPFDIIVALGDQDKGALLNQAFAAGKAVFVFRKGAEYFYNALMGNTTWASSTIDVGTYVTARTNLVPNPQVAVSTNSWFANAGTGAAITSARVATGGPTNGAFFRATFTTGNTTAAGTVSGASVVVDGRGTAALPMPVTPGRVYADAIYARTSVAQLLYAVARYYDSANVLISTLNGTPVLVAANTWTQLLADNTLAPANAAYVRVEAATVAGAGAVPFPVGATFDATMAQLEADVASVGSYFDGSTVAADPFTYAWTGAANNSTSIQQRFTGGQITPIPGSDERLSGWPTFTANSEYTTAKFPATSLTAFDVALVPGETLYSAVTSGVNSAGGKYMAVHYNVSPYQHADSSFRLFLYSAMNWLNPVAAMKVWETQIGEFMVDRIDEPHFPFEMKITGRDYTKKCMLSKFTQATNFAANQKLETVIASIAGAAGITKRALPATGVVIGRAFFYERGKTRWSAMKDICTAYNYEIYFDAAGFLVIRPYLDPSTSAPILYIDTGKEGSVAKYSKSTSDVQIFNHVLVAGENSDTTANVWAEAKNTDVTSPTRIAEIGDRYWEYISEFVTTTPQAQSLANSYLAIHSLEEFNLSFDTLMLPWLEVGEIIGFTDPRPAPDDPTTFLLATLSLSLGLGPMGGTGRRVTITG